MEQLLKDYEKLIYYAMKYFKNYPNKDDLYQVGYIGLQKAYKNYSSEFNTKFSSYACTYIFGEMRKLVREDKGIKVSRNISKLYLQIEKASILLSQKNMRQPSIAEIASFLNIDEFLVSDAINSVGIILDVDDISVGKSDDLDQQIMLEQELSKLTSDELDIITKRYKGDLTQQQIADALGITQVQVCRAEKKVLKKLKSRLAA